MKFIAFKYRNEPDSDGYRVGELLSASELLDLTPLISSTNLGPTEILKCFDLDGETFRRLNSRCTPIAAVDRELVEIASPVPRPGKIICIGLNYRDHAEESGMQIPASPIIFSKFSTSVIGPGQAIVLPGGSKKVDYEAELAFVIGRRAKKVRREDAMACIFGYTNFNDVSARDMQFADGQWQRGKSCDTFAPMGEFVATADEVKDPHDLGIRFRRNGETLQDSRTSQLIFGIPELIEFLSASITLEPGDIVATGTPPGVGFARKPPIFLQPGDICEVEIDGLGVLSNPVADA